MMEDLRGGGAGGNGEAGLRFALQFDPMRAGFDRTLLGLPVSALISRLLGLSKNSSRGSRLMAGEAGGETAAAVTVIATTAILYSAALFVSDQQLRRPRRRRLAALDRPSSAWLRALPAPDDGLRILALNDEPFENVIHGTSIGAGDNEPDLVARVEMKPADMEEEEENADGEPGRDQSERQQEEVRRVKELWLSLVEREQRLELRLMELDDLREQEATVRELENRVSVSAVETRLLELKVSSLQEKNDRLKAQASELDAVRAKPGRAKEKLQALKARVQDEAQHEAAALRERVEELENNGIERARALAKEVASLREANARLEEEKMELALRLQNSEDAAPFVNLVLDQEKDIVEEANYLRETNEKLRRQIEQLHSDHCAHVEELVYLKWVNACLRHELGGNGNGNGHHHPSSAQQDQQLLTAMDLSKSMSYRSSEKAKQLMLRYGNLGIDGFDPAVLFSPMNESLYGDDHHARGDHDDPVRSPDISVAMVAAAAPGKRAGHGHHGHGKLKFLGSIKKLLASSRKGHGHGHDRRSKKTPPHDEHLEKAMRWLSSHDVDNSYESTPLSSCERTPLSSVTTVDWHGRARGWESVIAPRLEPETLSRSKSDAGASYGREASKYHALRPDPGRSPAGRVPRRAREAEESLGRAPKLLSGMLVHET